MRKNGFTLIELMVGLLLSSLLMLTMVTLFKQVSQVGLNSSENSEYESQMEIGLLTIQRLIQNAGYGSGSQDDIAIGTYNTKDAIFWRSAVAYSPDPTVAIDYQCHGFGINISTAGNRDIHRLLLLKASPCSGTTNLADEDWQIEQTIATLKINPADNLLYTGDPVFEFSLSTGECVPFGISLGSLSGDVRVKVSGLRKYDYGVGNKERFVCLNNIKAP